jgi:hypothetical protein
LKLERSPDLALPSADQLYCNAWSQED